jgi:hypothetical protein
MVDADEDVVLWVGGGEGSEVEVVRRWYVCWLEGRMLSVGAVSVCGVGFAERRRAVAWVGEGGMELMSGTMAAAEEDPDAARY